MKKARTILSIVTATALLAATTGLVACGPKEPETIKIGVISSLTGTIAPYGESVWEGVQIGIDEINENGGIDGKQIEVIIEDDQSDAKIATTVMNKLIDEDGVPIVLGPVASSSVMAVAPIANERKTVVLSPAAASPSITEAGDYIFRNRAAGGLEALKLAEYAYTELGVKNVCLLYINTDYGIGYKGIILDTFTNLGGTIGFVESFDQGETDFRTLITKVSGYEPEAVFLLGNPYEVGLILKQSKELGFKTVYLSNNVESDELLEQAGDAANGLVFVLPYFDATSVQPNVRYFVEKYETRFGRIPDLYAANGYDAAYLCKIAIERGGYNAEGIKEALYGIKGYEGVNGLISFDENGDVEKPLTFKKVEDGEFVNIGL